MNIRNCIIIILCIILIYHLEIIYNLCDLENEKIDNLETGDVLFMIDNHLLKGEFLKFITHNLLYSICTTLYTHVGVIFKMRNDMYLITAENKNKCICIQKLLTYVKNYTGNIICFKNKNGIQNCNKKMYDFLNINKNKQYHNNLLSFLKIAFGFNGNFPINKTICTKNAIELLHLLGVNLNIDANCSDVKRFYNIITNSNCYCGPYLIL